MEEVHRHELAGRRGDDAGETGRTWPGRRWSAQEEGTATTSRAAAGGGAGPAVLVFAAPAGAGGGGKPKTGCVSQPGLWHCRARQLWWQGRRWAAQNTAVPDLGP